MSRVGWRNNNAFGSGVIDAAGIMAYETFVLMNDCIITKHLADYPDSPVKEECERALLWLDGAPEVEFTVQEKRQLMEGILSCICEKTGICVKYALWLASAEAVMDLYTHPEDGLTEITAYEKSPVMLSGDDYDGVLYGYENFPTREKIMHMAKTETGEPKCVGKDLFPDTTGDGMIKLKAVRYYNDPAKKGTESVHEVFEIISENHACGEIFLHRFYRVPDTATEDPVPVSALYSADGRELCRCKRAEEETVIRWILKIVFSKD